MTGDGGTIGRCMFRGFFTVCSFALNAFGAEDRPNALAIVGLIPKRPVASGAAHTQG